MKRQRAGRNLHRWFSGIVIAGATVLAPGVAATAGNAASLKDIVATCSACHGPTGNSTDPQYPKLAGQKASYLAAQLHNYKDGARKSDAMSALASTLGDQDIQGLAEFFSRQSIEPDAVKDEHLAARGKSIFYSGSRRIPSCAACHTSGGSGGMGGMGMGGMGMMHNMGIVPEINGQHAAYIIQQLDAFATGARQGTVMNQIAAYLSETDRKAVAEYVSALR